MADRSRLRLFVLQVLVISVLATLFGRLWFLQVHEGDRYAAAASANRVREIVTLAPRGEIFDAQGRPLVVNRTALVVSVNRSLLQREPDRGAAVLDRLSRVVGIPADVIAQQIRPCGGEVKQPCWRGSPYQPVPIKEYDVDARGTRQVLAIEERREDFPGVRAQFAAVRDYPRKTLGAHALGYLGPISEEERGDRRYADVQSTALIGRAGVEASYDAALRGRDGTQALLVDHVGRVTGVQGETPPQAGDKLVVSIDAAVQEAAEKALATGIARARTTFARNGSGRLKADSGAVVVMEARTGRVLALASNPTYDPRVFVGGISPKEYQVLNSENGGKPLISRATQGLFAPASTFKVVSTAGAVMSGHYPLRASYPCPGRYAPLNGKRNFEAAELGTIDLRTALVKSCDTIYYKFAYEQWVRDGGNDPVAKPRDSIFRMAHAFGFGQRTGIDLPSESKGRLEDRAFKKAFWEQTKDDYCAGAKRRKQGTFLQALAEDQCRDGFRLRAGDAANFAIGQGNTVVTPLQLAAVYAAVANGGTLVQPTVARALLSADGTRVTPIVAQPRGKVPVRKDVLDYIRVALAGVTQKGGTAAAPFAKMPVAVAGKTGTAEVAGKQDTSWFASFAPANKPEYVVVAMVSQGGTGGTVAAPIAADVYKALYGFGGRKPVLPGGRLPAALPCVRADQTVAPPGTCKAAAPSVVVPAPPADPREPAGPPDTPPPPTEPPGPPAPNDAATALGPGRRTGVS